PPLTVKLISPRPEHPPPPSDSAEALKRKLEELHMEERARAVQAAESAKTNLLGRTNRQTFEVRTYEVKGLPILPTNTLTTVLANYTGTNVGLESIIKAALELQAEYGRQGNPDVSVALAPKHITNGIVSLSVFQAATPQVVVGGMRYSAPPPADTNAPTKFPVHAYEVTGDTLLNEDTLRDILGKYTGTNIGVAEILKAGSELQTEYRDRGYPTVNVTIPPQQITNGIVRIRV